MFESCLEIAELATVETPDISYDIYTHNLMYPTLRLRNCASDVRMSVSLDGWGMFRYDIPDSPNEISVECAKEQVIKEWKRRNEK